jgi:hypothetical protein
MNVINHRQFGKRTGGHSKKWRVAVYTAVSLFSVFVLANIVMAVMYNSKVLPKYTLAGVPVGGKTYTEVAKMPSSEFLLSQVTLQKDSAHQKIAVSDLGIGVDWDKSVAALKSSKPFLPIVSLFGSHDVSVSLARDSQKLTDKLTSLQTTFSRPSTDKRVTAQGDTFAVEQATTGYALNLDSSANIIAKQIAAGKTNITLAVTSLDPGNNNGDLSGQLAGLKKQISTKVTLNYGGQKITPTAADMVAWYVHDGQTMSISDDKIGTYVDAAATKLHIAAANRSDLIVALKYVLGRNLATNFTISPAGASVVHTYCTAVNGVPASELDDLIGKLAATYSDTRGWNNNGKIAFKHVASGCEYKVVIAAPNLMTSYGAICDNYYNCQVGNSVIVNNDRWLYATDPWKKTGQNLETYRLLIINHETGHRLGFRDNPTCPGAGQPAPVMMQQSIDLKGCVFNTWPLTSELEQL